MSLFYLGLIRNIKILLIDYFENFEQLSFNSYPVKSVLLERDAVQMGLSENGGDSSQDGCFIEVDGIEAAAEELQNAGLVFEPKYRNDTHGATTYKVFFVVAPDGLCYCFGERQN